jgi:hypothetical protein
MFLAYNNGIAATAEEVVFADQKNTGGFFIKSVKDFQIVNGGQTTASIFHTLKKDRADISGIYVQLKLTVVKDRPNFSTIVSRISEYANTQNKVSASDLSANNPVFIELEKLSRLIFAPHIDGTSHQYKWFFERARGQYKSERAREGRTKARLLAFDLQNPRKQLFTKEDVAKYINSFSEINRANKILIGPHIVVKGSQKNHKAFVDFNLPKEIDNLYFEDLIAKAIFFKEAERIYGVKPNAIGDLRFITVPYTISYVNSLLKNPIDLYKIWKKQEITHSMRDLLKTLMIKIEEFIKTNAPGSLYGEWAKKEDCWNALKRSGIAFDISQIEDDIIDLKGPSRRKMNKEQLDFMESEFHSDKINAIKAEQWKIIKEWGRETDKLSLTQLDRIHNYLQKIGTASLAQAEAFALLEIIDIVAKEAPVILEETELEIEVMSADEIIKQQAKTMIDWIKENKPFIKSEHYAFIKKVRDGEIIYSHESKTTISALVKYLNQYGFS